MKRIFASLLLLGVFLPCGATSAQEQHDVSLMTICPEQVDINAFYKGISLQINGECQECDNLVLLVRGPHEKAEFKRKGREMLLWMTVARVRIEHVPVAYILQSSDSLTGLLDTFLADSLELGYGPLEDVVRIESEKPLEGHEFQQYVQFKESRKLYRIEPGVVKRESAGGGKTRFSSTCAIPASTPPGDYTVSMYAFLDGQLVASEKARLPIQKTGMPKYLTELAFQHPALYGVVAILVAMAAGMLMGVLFNRRNKGVH